MGPKGSTNPDTCLGDTCTCHTLKRKSKAVFFEGRARGKGNEWGNKSAGDDDRRLSQKEGIHSGKQPAQSAVDVLWENYGGLANVLCGTGGTVLEEEACEKDWVQPRRGSKLDRLRARLQEESPKNLYHKETSHISHTRIMDIGGRKTDRLQRCRSQYETRGEFLVGGRRAGISCGSRHTA